MLCLIELADIAWVIGTILIYLCLGLSLLYCALFLIFKIVDIIRKELE